MPTNSIKESSSSSSSISYHYQVKIHHQKIKMNNNNKKLSTKTSILKRANDERNKEKKYSKSLHHSLSSSIINMKSQSTIHHHCHDFLGVLSNPSDVKAKQVRGTFSVTE